MNSSLFLAFSKQLYFWGCSTVVFQSGQPNHQSSHFLLSLVGADETPFVALSLSAGLGHSFLHAGPPASIVKYHHHFLKLLFWALPKCLRLSLTSKYVLTCRWSHFFQMPIVLLWADGGFRRIEKGDREETGNCQNAVENISKSMSWISWKLLKEEVLERQLETLVMVTRSSSSSSSPWSTLSCNEDQVF